MVFLTSAHLLYPNTFIFIAFFQIFKMNFLSALSVFITLLSTTCAQIFSTYNLFASPTFNPTPAQQRFFPQPVARTDYSHPDVVANSIAESQLPPEMLNDFYKNPALASALAKDSWFGNKEMPVFDRESSRIPRSEIFKIFRRAGWIRRK